MLKDGQAKKRILQRIERSRENNFEEHKQLAENLFEMRIFSGPGYCVYYTKQGNTVCLLLVGGDKSTQSKDIELVLEMIKVL